MDFIEINMDILLWITYILTLLLGYAIGRNSLTMENVDNLLKTAKKKIMPSRVGAIKRPDAQTLYNRANPLIAQEKEAVQEALEKIL